mmetsp:Transcript_15380/g.25056  ORF Transcript_15380/g.25056 Transcript_15380/m.25056 type:complete len:91 (-) Transcript_15380:50-322(-)
MTKRGKRMPRRIRSRKMHWKMKKEKMMLQTSRPRRNITSIRNEAMTFKLDDAFPHDAFADDLDYFNATLIHHPPCWESACNSRSWHQASN